jgi:hypothetical protein
MPGFVEGVLQTRAAVAYAMSAHDSQQDADVRGSDCGAA